MFEILLKKNLPEKQRFPVKKRLGSIHEIKKGSDMLWLSPFHMVILK